MDIIREWAFVICITALGASLFSMLAPNSNMEKVMRFTISLFFLSGIISPIASGSVKFDYKSAIEYKQIESYKEELAEGVREQYRRMAEGEIVRLIAAAIPPEQAGIKKIEAIVNIDEDNSISINNITVTIAMDSRYGELDIKQILKRETGLEVEVIRDGS
ncbi:MAG: stage III sporulation protein AF [Oscillospiraceae bacterium]|nr:stage III sporulation protein AF [Oscillospiraceae bacterium]